MNSTGSTTPEPTARGDNLSPQQPVQNLLIVEPESLIRWSLVTYLAKWFTVYAADSGSAADRFLDEHWIDAAVVSDDLPRGFGEQIEARARSLNSSVRLVCTVTDPPGERACTRTTRCLEKPFELAELANLLGIESAPRAAGFNARIFPTYVGTESCCWSTGANRGGLACPPAEAAAIMQRSPLADTP